MPAPSSSVSPSASQPTTIVATRKGWVPGVEASCSFRSSFCAMARMALRSLAGTGCYNACVTPASAAPEDRRIRCAWATSDPLYEAYHDEEWGVPLHDERALFEL